MKELYAWIHHDNKRTQGFNCTTVGAKSEITMVVNYKDGTESKHLVDINIMYDVEASVVTIYQQGGTAEIKVFDKR